MPDLKCLNCGKQLPADSMFCQFCGKKINDIDSVNIKSENENNFSSTIQANVDLLDSLQKRKLAVLAAEKRKSRDKKIVISIISAIAIFFIAIFIKDIIYNGQLRNMATDAMNKNYTNVYADVISIQPEYIIYRYKTTRYGTKIGDGDLWTIVCRCKTVEGKTIWASFFYQDYPGGNYSKNEKDYKNLSYARSNPMHLTGNIRTAHQVSKELDTTFDGILFLNVQNASQLK